jgi:hypothetical protein
MWAVWGIVQAKEDLLARIQGWKEKAAERAKNGDTSVSSRSRSRSPGAEGDSDAEEPEVQATELARELEDLKVEQEEAKDEEEEEEWEAVEGEVFDYLSYAAERMEMFRKELASLGVI